MHRNHRNTCQIDILWKFLVGATFFVCIFITYEVLLSKGFICFYQSECLEISDPTSEQLFQEECSSFCSTKECTDISQLILSFMNRSADPCEDFNNFACGMYHEKYTDGENHWTVNDDLLRELSLNVKEALEEVSTSTPRDDFSAKYKLKLVYDSCMDKKSSDLDSASAVLKFLNSVGIVRDRSSLRSSFTFDNISLPEVLGKLLAFQEVMFFKLLRGNKMGDYYKLAVSSPDPPFKGTDTIAELSRVMHDILPSFFMDADEINGTMADYEYVYNFLESNICKEKSIFKVHKLQCVGDEEQHFVCQLADAYVTSANLLSIYRTEEITISCTKDTLKNITTFLKETDQRAIANYIAVNVIIQNLIGLGFIHRRRHIKISADYLRYRNNEDINLAEKIHKEFCLNWIMHYMKFPLGGAFVSRYWPTNATDEINEIYQDYLREIKRSVMNQNWISNKTKEDLPEALDKAQNFMMGLIEDMKNQSFINSLYSMFHPVRSSFVSNILAHRKMINTAKEMHDKEFFHRYYINDYFETILNPFSNNANGEYDVYLSFGVMSRPFYYLGYPRLFNLAKIGQLIGHEIGHIINYFMGRLGKRDKTLLKWKKKNECLIEKYSRFKLKHSQKFMDGKGTISEDIADIIGLTFTENVSKPILTDMENKDFMLPGLSYSPEQLLYISYHQVFCSIRTPQFEEEMVRRDQHSPPEFRIIGPLQNSERFSKIFNCPSTSYMNSNVKCPVFE